MPVNTFSFTTGPAALPDVGKLSYNGCIFSPLFESSVVGSFVKDNSGRTTKIIEYLLTADGYVTLTAGSTDISTTMQQMYELLSAQSGALTYEGRGCNIDTNPQSDVNKGQTDVAWGPDPQVLEFQPLGAGQSAKVKWQCKVRMTAIRNTKTGQIIQGTQRSDGTISGKPAPRILQFNYDSSVTYGEDGYSSISVRGTLEIALNRNPAQTTRTLTTTVDDYRSIVASRILSSVDLSRFRIVNRKFDTSRDKRTLEWSFDLEEKPYMDIPQGCTLARGSYSVRPARQGMGLCSWLCTLRATYTVRKDAQGPRRLAWVSFLALLRLRMSQSQFGYIPPQGGNQEPPPPANNTKRDFIHAGAVVVANFTAGPVVTPAVLRGIKLAQDARSEFNSKASEPLQSGAWIIDLSIEEGLYLDSKTTTFSATWKLVTTLSHILLASGLWTKVAEETTAGSNLWATSVIDIMGDRSWLTNRLDPKLDAVIDFGF